MADNFKDLINKIKCGEINPSTFTQDDLDKVKSCLPTLPPIQGEKVDSTPLSFEDSCLPGALEQAGKIIEESQKNVAKINEVAAVKGRVQEYQDNLKIVQQYYTERLNFFLLVSSSVDPITAQKLAVKSQIAEAVQLGADYSGLVAQAEALTKKADAEITQKITGLDKIVDSSTGRQTFAKALATETGKISKKIMPDFTDRAMTFKFRFIDLVSTKISDGQTEKTIAVQTSEYLKNPATLKSIGTYVYPVTATAKQNTDDVNSKLYDGLGNYGGHYRRLRTPIQSFFTLEERGLSVNSDDVDAKLKENKDLPRTFKENEEEFFIKSLDKFEKFHEELGKALVERIEVEKTVTYPAAISAELTAIKKLARREVAHQIRTESLSSNLSRDTVYNNVKYTATDSGISKALKIYQDSVERVNKKLEELDSEIASLDSLISEYAVNPDTISAKITSIPCFNTPANNASGCEESTKQKKGTDPFGIKTLFGTNAALPDMTTACYWKYFTEELNKLALLPIPDLTSPLFRYYPVNAMIPAFPGPIILTLPQKFKVLAVVSSPIGTIIPMISLPITMPSFFPIPLPSIFIFYIAPDGNKYMIAAPNIPFLLQPGQSAIGYEFDSSPSAQNPAGLSGPWSGLPIKGSLSIPLSISAKSTKASRLTKLAIDAVQGKPLTVTMPNGKIAPGDLGELTPTTALNELKSENEFSIDAVETTPEKDFDRLVANIRLTINTQLDSIGDVAFASIQKLKAEISDAKDSALNSAIGEPNSERRRKLKAASRYIDPLTLDDKVEGLVADMNSLIDNLSLGEITYPDDPSKLNPKMSAALTSILDLVQLSNRGGLKNERDSNLLSKIRRVNKKLDPTKFSTKAQFDLDNPDDVTDIKKVLTGLSKSCIDYLSGKPADSDTSEGRTKEESTKIGEANAEMQDLLVKTLSFTAIAFASPPKVSVFDPSKPCCETNAEPLFKGVRPEILAIFSVFSSLSAAVISGVTREDIKAILGTDLKTVSINQIKNLFDEIIKTLPAIKIPKGFNAASLLSSIIVPFLSAISLPEIQLPTRPIPMFQVKIPLDALIKPLLKIALSLLIRAIFNLMADLFKAGTDAIGSGAGINSTIDIDDVIRELDCGAFGIVKLQRIRSNQVQITLPNGKTIKLPLFPDLPLDIFKYFAFMMSTDFISLIKSLLNAALDQILDPIEAIVKPILSLVPKGSWSSFSVLDSVNPLAAIIKIIKLKLEESIPNGAKINLLNMDVYPLVLAAALPLLENLEKVLKEIAYLGTAVLCSTGGAGVTIARMAHPIFNQDDLPPWERLTRKNPLFTIFLDEILYKSTIMSLGTLIFHTKLPGMYGTTTVPTLFVAPPRI